MTIKFQINAIVPNSEAKSIVEDMLFESGESEVAIGLEAQVGVPPGAWRWEAKLWRKFVYRGGWAEASNDPTKVLNNLKNYKTKL